MNHKRRKYTEENNDDLVLQIKKLSKNAIIPSKASKLAAGYDLYSAVDTIIPAKDKSICNTDIAIAIPPNHYGRVGK